MHLTHVVVHELEKQPGDSSARAHYSTACLPLDEGVRALAEELDRGFGGSRLVDGRFDDAPGKLFPQKLADYLAGPATDAAFLEYTREVVGHLETVIQGKSGAKGGYLVLCAYDDAEGSRHGVFLVRDTVGRVLRRTDDGFDVEPVVHLDTGQVAMACRIDVGKYRRGAGAYLELTHRSEREVSAYFSDWIGVEPTASRRDMTAALRELLGEIDPPVDAATGEVASQATTFERAYEHVRASPTRVVDIHELSQELYGSSATLETAARERGVELESEFRYDPRALKTLVALRATASDLDLRFPRAAMEDGVMRVEGEGEAMRVVIESPALARAILGQA